MDDLVYLTPKQASEILQMNYYTFMKILHDPDSGLPFSRINRRILINKNAFQDWIESNTHTN